MVWNPSQKQLRVWLSKADNFFPGEAKVDYEQLLQRKKLWLLSHVQFSSGNSVVVSPY